MQVRSCAGHDHQLEDVVTVLTRTMFIRFVAAVCLFWLCNTELLEIHTILFLIVKAQSLRQYLFFFLSEYRFVNSLPSDDGIG